MFKRIGFTKVQALFLLGALFVALTAEDCTTESSRQFEAKVANTQSLMAKQPTPVIDFSMDRYLLAERLTRFNDPNKMTYLYINFFDGSWVQVTIIGKLASTSKRLTSPENLQQYGSEPVADEMAVWGSSQPDKVGMTTLGSLVEFGGMVGFIYSEVPLIFKNLKSQMVEIQVQATPTEVQNFRQQLTDMRQKATKH